MSATNSVVLTGRICTDIYMNNGFAKFSIAVQQNFKGKDDQYGADFPKISASGKTAEFIEKYFKKGELVTIQGSIRTSKYENKDGVKVDSVEVRADDVKKLIWDEKKDTSAPDDGFKPIGEDADCPW